MIVGEEHANHLRPSAQHIPLPTVATIVAATLPAATLAKHPDRNVSQTIHLIVNIAVGRFIVALGVSCPKSKV